MSTVLESVYQDVENPLHNENRPPLGPRKAILDGEVSLSDAEDSLKIKEKAAVDYSGHYAVLLMFLVGCFSGVLVNIVLWAAQMLSLMQAKLIVSNPAGPFCLMLTTAALCGLAAFVCKKSGRVAVLGSGIPEVKALLTNEFHPTELAMIVSSRIGYTRMVALILTLGSGLSIGSAAPLVHMTVCNAFTIMKFSPDFGCLLENTNMMRQIFNASAAAGMAACFNCPLGGVLFSIEVTSSHYLLVNYWRSFMAAVAGAVLFSMILWWRGIYDSRPFPLDYIANPYKHWEFPLFFLLGVVCGFASYLYLFMQQQWFLLVRKINVAHPIAMAAGIGAFSALMIFAVGSYSAKGVTCGTIVTDLLNSGDASELTKYNDVSRIGGLFATLVIRWMLTIISTTLRIPAGFFTPMIMIGAIIGRIFGLCVQKIVGATASIYVSGYALVGACAFASGTTHTISAAIVMLESTGQLSMFLPCLIGAIVGSGCVKGYTVSLYNQGLINKGLESFEQLLLESGDFQSARDMMDKRAVYVTRHCQIGDLFALMEHVKLSTFAVIDSVESCKLIGSIARKDVYQFLKLFYAKHGLVAFVRQMLPDDTKQDDYRTARRKKMEARTQWLRTQIVLPSEVADEAALNAAAAQNGGAFSFASISGSTHGNTAAAGGSGASHTPLPSTGRVMLRSIYSSRDEDDHSSDEELEAAVEDSANDYDPRTNLTGGNEFNASTYQMAVELAPIVRRLSGADETVAEVPRSTSPAGVPTPVQIQALFDAQKAAARSDYSARHSTGGMMSAQQPDGSSTYSPLFSSQPDQQQGQQGQQGQQQKLPQMPRPTSFGKFDGVVGRITSVMKSKRKMRESLAHMDKEQEARAQLLLKASIDILKEELLPVNVDPFTVHSNSLVDQVYMLFNSVKVNCVFVVEEDLVLQGMISQENLMQRLKKKKN